MPIQVTSTSNYISTDRINSDNPKPKEIEFNNTRQLIHGSVDLLSLLAEVYKMLNKSMIESLLIDNNMRTTEQELTNLTLKLQDSLSQTSWTQGQHAADEIMTGAWAQAVTGAGAVVSGAAGTFMSGRGVKNVMDSAKIKENILNRNPDPYEVTEDNKKKYSDCFGTDKDVEFDNYKTTIDKKLNEDYAPLTKMKSELNSVDDLKKYGDELSRLDKKVSELKISTMRKINKEGSTIRNCLEDAIKDLNPGSDVTINNICKDHGMESNWIVTAKISQNGSESTKEYQIIKYADNDFCIEEDNLVTGVENSRDIRFTNLVGDSAITHAEVKHFLDSPRLDTTLSKTELENVTKQSIKLKAMNDKLRELRYDNLAGNSKTKVILDKLDNNRMMLDVIARGIDQATHTINTAGSIAQQFYKSESDKLHSDAERTTAVKDLQNKSMQSMIDANKSMIDKNSQYLSDLIRSSIATLRDLIGVINTMAAH